MLILLLLSYLAIFVAAGYRLYIDRNSMAIAIVVVALVYGMISLTCVARLAGVLPSPRGGLLEQAFPYINTYWQGSTAMAVYLFFIATNLFVACSILWRMRLSFFIAVIVLLFLLCGITLSCITNVSPITTLFGTCCAFMAIVGYSIGLTYEEWCVIGNNYIQMLLVFSSAVWLCIAAWENVRQKPVKIHRVAVLTSSLLVFLYALLLIVVCWTYRPPLVQAFHDCVIDLNTLANCWHTSYFHVNILIYIVAFLVAIAINILSRLLLKKNHNVPAIILMLLHLTLFIIIYYIWPI